MSRKSDQQICALCKQQRPLTFHHLIPRKLHRRSHFRRHYEKSELNQGIYICRLCHRGLHRIYDEMTLGKHFFEAEKILNDPQLLKHIEWSAKQKVK